MVVTKDVLYDRLVNQAGFDKDEVDSFFSVYSLKDWLSAINAGDLTVYRLEQKIDEWINYENPMEESTTLTEGWTSAPDWRNVADVQDALKFSEISSDYEFVKNFGNFFCYKRKSDGRPTVAYYLIKSFGPGNGFGYKDMSACYSGRYNAGAANWLKQALLDYGSTPKNPGEFEESWKWIEEGKHELEQRADYKNTLKKGDKVNFGNVIVTYDRPYNNQAFVGYAEDEPDKPYKWYYRKIVDLVKENMQLREAKQLLQENGYILNESIDEDFNNYLENARGWLKANTSIPNEQIDILVDRYERCIVDGFKDGYNPIEAALDILDAAGYDSKGNPLKESTQLINESDGWDLEAAGIEGLDEVMEQTDSLLYELRNCVRGAYTEAENWAELGEYIKNLAADWENIGEVMIELNDELPTEDDE